MARRRAQAQARALVQARPPRSARQPQRWRAAEGSSSAAGGARHWAWRLATLALLASVVPCRAGVSRSLAQKTGKSASPSKSPSAPKPATITIGTSPTFWAVGVQSSWRQPTVRQGDTLEFRWDKKSLDPPHDVWLINSTTFYSCQFPKKPTPGKIPYRISPSGNSVTYRYPVKDKRGSVLYFACSYGFHCEAGMKVSIRVS